MNEQDREQMELRAAGWESVERSGVVIWQSPEGGFFYSREMVVEMVRDGKKPYVPKCLGGAVA